MLNSAHKSLARENHGVAGDATEPGSLLVRRRCRRERRRGDEIERERGWKRGQAEISLPFGQEGICETQREKEERLFCVVCVGVGGEFDKCYSALCYSALNRSSSS